MLNLKYNYFEIDLKSKKHRSEFYMEDIQTIDCKWFKEWQLKSRIKLADSTFFNCVFKKEEKKPSAKWRFDLL